MRPVHPNLAARLRRGDSSFRYIVEAHAITQADYKQTQDDWLAGDGPPSASDFEFVADGGLRLAPSIANLVSSTTGSSYFTDLNNDFAYADALISWGGTDDRNVEIQRVTANLHPDQGGTGRTVVWWKCQLFSVTKVLTFPHVGNYPQVTLSPLGTPVTVAATGNTVGDVTFDFSTQAVKPKPKLITPESTGDAASRAAIQVSFPWYTHPCTIVRITALKADGSAATNVGWGYDNSITTFGAGNVLRNASIDNHYPGSTFKPIAGWVLDTGSVGVPKLTISTGSFTAKTITFSSGNLLDMGAAPAGVVYLAALADTPSGSSVTFEIRNDADSAWVSYVDGQTFTDVGLVATQTRKVRATLTPNGAGTVSPTLRRLGMEEKAIVDLSHVAEISRYNAHVDPITCEGRTTTATLRGLKNGRADFASTIEDLLTTYDIASLEFRWYVGDTRLNHSQWTLIDAFPVIDDFEPNAATVEIELLGANALISSALPKYDLSGSGVVVPDSTVANPGSWTDQAGGAVNIYLTIDENPADDTDYVKSPNSPSNASVDFGLGNLADPGRDTGHYVDIRWRKSAAGGEVQSLVVELRQGATVKMTSEVMTAPDEWTDTTLALTAAQAQSISDYTDLRVRLVANVLSGAGARNVQVSWVEFRVVGQRTDLVYDNVPADEVYADLLSQAEVPGRYIGQGLTDTLVVSKTITDSDASTQVDSLCANFGKSVISTRGVIQAIDLFSPRAADVHFTKDSIEPLRIVPGFRERRPRVSVLWNWSEEKNRFDDEALWQSTVALTKLGIARVDAEEKWSEESSKWLYSGSQARAIAQRTGQAVATGLMLWRFAALDHWPEIECGDVAAIETTRFLAKDPHSSRALKGHLIAAATITDTTYEGGTWQFTGWVQSYADITGGGIDSVTLKAETETILGYVRARPTTIGEDWDISAANYARPAVSTGADQEGLIHLSPSELPNGAVIRSYGMRFYVNTASAGSALITNLFWAAPIDGTTPFQIADLTGDSSIDSLATWQTKEVVATHTVDWSTYHYYTETALRAAGTIDNCRFMWNRIDWD